jgi:hypothetical protein
MMFSVDDYQNFDCSRIPPFVDHVRVAHLPTGVTFEPLPTTQYMERGQQHWLFQSGPDADWKARVIQSRGLFQGKAGQLEEDRAKALGLPYETQEDQRFFRRNIGTFHAFSMALAYDGHPLPPWTEELVTILLKCKIVSSSPTAWRNRTPPRAQEIVFQVDGAPAHLQDMSVIVRYKDL